MGKIVSLRTTREEFIKPPFKQWTHLLSLSSYIDAFSKYFGQEEFKHAIEIVQASKKKSYHLILWIVLSDPVLEKV